MAPGIRQNDVEDDDKNSTEKRQKIAEGDVVNGSGDNNNDADNIRSFGKDGTAGGSGENESNSNDHNNDNSENEIPAIGQVLNSASTPLADRFRALFTLKNLGGAASIAAIGSGFHDPDNGALIKHELAYCLGQMGDPAAIPVLTAVLTNLDEDVMVRHEAGEALGAIGDESALDVLRRHLEDPAAEVAETCELAVERIEWLKRRRRKNGTGEELLSENPYNSVDPAPPEADATSLSTDRLKAILVDESLPLFRRYRSMFELRNRGGSAAVAALCAGLACPKSALFRHEIAYVLGQMQHPDSLQALEASLIKDDENEMVRHECAEAIGSVATPEAFRVLSSHVQSPIRVVRESCEVALDMADHEASGELQYADTLAKIKAAVA